MRNFFQWLGDAMTATLLGLFPCSFFAHQPKRPDSFAQKRKEQLMK